jgi:hypothetical protein
MEKGNRFHLGASRLIPLALLVAAAVAIAIGILSGEHLTVLQKATMICLECIGLG